VVERRVVEFDRHDRFDRFRDLVARIDGGGRQGHRAESDRNAWRRDRGQATSNDDHGTSPLKALRRQANAI
jgi:hypothetical protein